MHDIRPLAHDDVAPLREHFRRHLAESGRGDPHFVPFVPGGPEGPVGLDAEAMTRPLSEPGWQRWFLAVTERGEIVGHVNLKGDKLRAGLHRCDLGIGIERAHRAQGLGRRLMQTAIEFARNAPTLAWIDLRVFGHNARARALYVSLGFAEVGTLADRFRIEGQSIDDVIMTLRIR